MEREYAENGGSGRKLVKLMTGVAAGLVTAFVMSLIFGFVLTIGVVPDGLVSLASLLSAIAASFVCGFVAVRGIGSGGLLYGALSGFMLFVIQAILSLIFGGSLFTLDMLIALLVNTAVGAVGGVTAVNTGR